MVGKFKYFSTAAWLSIFKSSIEYKVARFNVYSFHIYTQKENKQDAGTYKKMWQQLTEIKTKSQNSIKRFRMLMYVTYINHFQSMANVTLIWVWEWLITYLSFQCKFYGAKHVIFNIHLFFFVRKSDCEVNRFESTDFEDLHFL